VGNGQGSGWWISTVTPPLPNSYHSRIGGQGSFTRLDLQLARKCLQEGRALVIAANKFDLLKEGMSTQQYEDGVREHCAAKMPEFGEVPVVACSASERQGMNRSGPPLTILPSSSSVTFDGTW